MAPALRMTRYSKRRYQFFHCDRGFSRAMGKEIEVSWGDLGEMASTLVLAGSSKPRVNYRRVMFLDNVCLLLFPTVSR